jgi:hypothetical protein
MWKLYDPDPANLQKPGQRSRRRHDAIGDIHLIVGHQIKAAGEKTKSEVGFARPGRPDQKDRVLIP